ncbi:MAG: 3-dehydroquinate synthase [Polyangiales bacterium]
MTIFLSGPMGAGKSTVAKLLSSRLGVEAVDLDERIEHRAGRTIPEIFREQGEPAFRALEREVALGLATSGAVVALGGGAVTDATTRRALLERGTLITLTAAPEELARRCGDGAGRPLLVGREPVAVLRDLLERRAAAYAEAHGVVRTDGKSSAEVADEVLAVVRDAPVVVALGERSYRVEIGSGIRARLAARAREAASGDVVLVHDADADAGRPWPAEAEASLRELGRRVVGVRLDAGEEHKTIHAAERVWDAALEAGVDRRCLVVGVGGGVVGDLTAFAASTLLRGVALGQLPTTLLSMVDSSVGGKTGFNRAAGKNLVGTFYQPKFVICDVATLSTLPDAERVAGLAEVVKSAWLDGEASVAALERDAAALRAGDEAATIRAVRMSVGLKARIVASDETESGPRMLLNLGHTVGHGLEAAGEYRELRHGEAVALGMVAALRVSRSLGRVTDEASERMVGLLDALGLPTDLDARLSDSVFHFMTSDKKKAGGSIRFIAPGEPGQTEIVPLSAAQIRAAVEVAGRG